ncbi:hypothetical protein [Salipiger abyssi]|uniref:hypothetical protein n=1 Tax=Salipiger abyssi TaxID=1250539 RepID=UPI001A8C70F2|nr:hypothetical protein [Salipiger abyssi]MBN9888483.1 hypothetical protein [Salipiger abyssi]
MLELSAPSSHLYPGALCRVEEGALADGPVVVLFADGSRAGGELAGGQLQLSAYETRAGTPIPARLWQIDTQTLRIAARLH